MHCVEGRRKSCSYVPNRPVLLFLRLQRALTARRATHSKVESPIKRLKIPNSTSRDPAPAVQVSLMLSGGTPVFRFTWIEKRGRSSVTVQSWSHNLLITSYLVSCSFTLWTQQGHSPSGKECLCWCSQRPAASGQPSHEPSEAARCRNLRSPPCQKDVLGPSAGCEMR